MMIKQGIKNYFINFKHFFTPLGTLLLGIVLGCSIALPGIFTSIKNMIQEINAISNEIHLDFPQFQNYLLKTLQSLNWSQPLDTLQMICSEDWLLLTFKEGLNQLLGNDFTVYGQQIMNLIELCIQDFYQYFVLFILCVLLSLIVGFLLTKYLVRRTIAKRSWWKFLLHWGIDSLISTALLFLTGWLFLIWEPSGWISMALSLIIFGAISLFEAYIIQGFKKVSFQQIVNLKNIGQFLLTNLMIFAIAMSFTWITQWIFNSIMAMFVGISLFEIAFLVISMNAEAYVKTSCEMATAK